jgi:hypothetical protein
MDLQIDALQGLYNHVRSELARVRIELEVPDADGNYPTNITNFIEAIPKPQMSDLTKYNGFLKEAGVPEPIEKTCETFIKLSANLSKLPRITREFFTVMIERREIGATDRVEINADKLDRISRYADKEGELRVLKNYDFVWLDDPNEPGGSYHWRIRFPGTPPDFKLLFLDYVEANEIQLSKPLVSLDFSAF